MRLLLLVTIFAMALGTGACRRSRRGNDDSNLNAGGDASVTLDDAEVTPRDSSVRDATVRDSATPDATVSCDPVRYGEPDPSLLGTCVSYASCFASATSDAEARACWDAESEDCRECLNTAAADCASLNGCGEALGQVNCCVAANCDRADAACTGAGGPCSVQWQAFEECIPTTVFEGLCDYPDARCS